MDAKIKDATIESLRKILLNIKFEGNYPVTKFSSFKWNQLLCIFENDELFMQLTSSQVLDLCKEVNSRLCKNEKVPSAIMKINVLNEDKLRDGGFVHAKTKSDASIEINVVDRNFYSKTDKLFRRNIGLDYLSAVIQETRRSMQHYYKNRMLTGKSTPKYQVYLAIEYLMRLSIKHDLGDNTLLINDKFLNLNEQDVCFYTQKVMNEFIKQGNFNDKNKLQLYASNDIINKYLTIEGLDANSAKQKLSNFEFITKVFELKARGSYGKFYREVLRKLGDKDLVTYVENNHIKMQSMAKEYLASELEYIKDDKYYEKHMPVFRKLYDKGLYFELFTCIDYMNEMKIADLEELRQYEEYKKESLRRVGFKRNKDGNDGKNK